jgi:hypothetical protein
MQTAYERAPTFGRGRARFLFVLFAGSGLRYIGQVVNGEDDTTSEAAKAFMGAHEKYAFNESGGATTVDVELDSEEEFVAMFDDAWPLALARLKAIVEARS